MAKPFRGVVNVDITQSVPDWEPYTQPIAPKARQTEAAGPGDRLAAGRDPELPVEGVRLGLNRVRGKVQPLADLREREMRGKQRQKPQLGCRERRRADGDCLDLVEVGLKLLGLSREDAEVRTLLEDVVDLPQDGGGTARVRERDIAPRELQEGLD